MGRESTPGGNDKDHLGTPPPGNSGPSNNVEVQAERTGPHLRHRDAVQSRKIARE